MAWQATTGSARSTTPASGAWQRSQPAGAGALVLDHGHDDQALAAGPRLLILEEATAQKLLNKVGQFDFVAATATDGTDEAALTATLRTIVPSTDQVITGDSFIEETESSISTVISLFTQPILAFGYISVFVGVFVIYNTFSIVVAQRTRELALLRAVGASRGQILGSVLLEASIVGLVASVLGIASGWILAVALKGLLSKAFTLPAGVPAPNLTSILTSLAVGLGPSFLETVERLGGSTAVDAALRHAGAL